MRVLFRVERDFSENIFQRCLWRPSPDLSRLGAIHDESHFLNDLHLNSIAVGQLMGEASRRLELPPPVAPTDYADATVIGAARALEFRVASAACEGRWR